MKNNRRLSEREENSNYSKKSKSKEEFKLDLGRSGSKQAFEICKTFYNNLVKVKTAGKKMSYVPGGP